MSLIAGTRIGAYEILDTLGAGGMGEVYRARDTHLGRDVAIKVLPEAFAHDTDRVARFEREARTLAALNHPNIAGVYGLEKRPAGSGPAAAFAADAASAPREAGHYIALVMELVEGPTLADRIAQGPIPVDEAIPLASQIAQALEAAHENGVIHRDLKPANIKVRPDGTVKVLDFGLAKAMEPVGAETSSASLSPTITTPAMTLAGVILGTAAYMSPEQASGKAVGKRADIWSFGVVLWEMLTGKRLFEGETISHTLAFILTKEPDWSTLPAATPEPIRRVLRRCLEKSPRHRLADIADARFELDEAASEADAREVTVAAEWSTRHGIPTRRRTMLDRAVWFATGTVLTLLVGYGWFASSAKSSVQPVRFMIGPVGGQSIQISTFDRDVVISPDGKRILYVSTEGGRRQLMARPIDQLASVPLHEINSASIAVSLFVSPDSQWVGFFEGDELKKVSITGGPAIPLCKFEGNPRGASWGPDNTIVFATSVPGLRRVSSAGGDPEVLTKIDVKAGEIGHVYPSLLPDGRSALFVINTTDSNKEHVAIADLQTGQYKVLIRGGRQAKYLASGHLVYASAGTLWAIAFDPNRRETSGEAIPVLNQLMTLSNGAANFDVSSTGTMVFIAGAANQTAIRSLVWVDRHGREDPIPAPPRAYVAPRLSPDETRIAVDSRDQQEDILLWDLARKSLTTLTRNPRLDERPVWTPDGQRIVFNSGVRNIYWQSADGTGAAEPLTDNENVRGVQSNPSSVNSITPDGTQLLVDGASTIGVLPLQGDASARRSLKSLVQGAVNARNPEVSPDGKWLAYQSSESNQPQIYVRPFPEVEGGRWQISMAGGIRPMWARNRRDMELFYIDASDALMSVSVQAVGARLVPGNPIKLFDARQYFVRTGFSARTYDISADGQRFLMVKDSTVGESGSSGGPVTINVVMNWLEELKQRVPLR